MSAKSVSFPESRSAPSLIASAINRVTRGMLPESGGATVSGSDSSFVLPAKRRCRKIGQITVRVWSLFMVGFSVGS